MRAKLVIRVVGWCHMTSGMCPSARWRSHASAARLGFMELLLIQDLAVIGLLLSAILGVFAVLHVTRQTVR